MTTTVKLWTETAAFCQYKLLLLPACIRDLAWNRKPRPGF